MSIPRTSERSLTSPLSIRREMTFVNAVHHSQHNVISLRIRNALISRNLRPTSCLEDEFSRFNSSTIDFEELLRQSLARVGYVSSHIIGAYYRPMTNKLTDNVYGQPMVVFVTETGDFMEYCLSEHFVIPISLDNEELSQQDVKADTSKFRFTKPLTNPVSISGGQIKFVKVSMDF